MIPLSHYLALSTFVFCAGVYGLLTRKSALSLYISIELLFNAANLNFIAFSRHIAPGNPAGQVFALFTIAISAAEFGVGIAIILLLFRQLRTVRVSEVAAMKG